MRPLNGTARLRLRVAGSKMYSQYLEATTVLLNDVAQLLPRYATCPSRRVTVFSLVVVIVAVVDCLQSPMNR